MNDENLKNDRRLNGQEDHLMNASPTRKIYSGEGHEHCVFCRHKFMENADNAGDRSGEGYCTGDGRHRICEECFKDFGELFKWEIM